MAFSSSNGYASRRRGGTGLAEINITPFVDVLLVLLIIFMLTAHVMQFGLEVEVPHTRFAKDTAREMPVVSITKDGTSYLNGKPTSIYDLAAAIHERFGRAKGVYVSADREAIWDVIAQVTAELGAGGFQVNMVTQPEDHAREGRK